MSEKKDYITTGNCRRHGLTAFKNGRECVKCLKELAEAPRPADSSGSNELTGCEECGKPVVEVGFRCEGFTVCQKCYATVEKDWLNWQNTAGYKHELIHGTQLPDLIK